MHKAVLMLLLAVVSSGAFAGDFDDGVAAYERKDFATALKIFHSTAAILNGHLIHLVIQTESLDLDILGRQIYTFINRL